jgi:hypothetical protein
MLFKKQSLHSCLRPEACVIDRKTTTRIGGTLVIRSSDNPAIKSEEEFLRGEKRRTHQAYLAGKLDR